jgi:hypothetical protein
MALTLADRKGAFLFQAFPDLVPEGYCTHLELELWSLYFEEMNAKAEARGR